MLRINDMAYFKQVVRKAKEMGGKSWESFKRQMHFLGHYRGGRCVCMLYRDFAPLSFEFVLAMGDQEYGDESYKPRQRLFNGGVIAHGANSNGVSAPELSVTLSPKPFVNWQVHT